MSANSPKQVFVDLGYRGVDRDHPNVEVIHRRKYRSLTRQQRRCLRLRPAPVEPTIGHLQADHRMDRCWLRGQLGDALCTLGYRKAARHERGTAFARIPSGRYLRNIV